jgi:hypothetical protein
VADLKASVARGTMDIEARVEIVDRKAKVTYYVVKRQGDRILAEGELALQDAATLIHMRG